MLELTGLLNRLKGPKSVAEILAKINATSLQEEEDPLSRDWLNGLFSGRKAVEVWELQALARGLSLTVADPKDAARRRVEIYRQMTDLAFPLAWDGSDAV